MRAQGLGRPAALGMGSQAAEVGDGPDGWGPSVSEREKERRLFGLEWAGLAVRERKGGREKRKRVWAGIEKKEGERDVCFCFLSKAKDLFDIKTFQI